MTMENEVDAGCGYAELAKALAAFQGEMKTVAFDSNNPYFSSRYASLAALVAGASKLLAKNGLAVSQIIRGDGAVDTYLLHSSGQFIHGLAKIPPAPRRAKKDARGEEVSLDPNYRPTPQELCASITYCRRYAYAAILGLVSDEDDDGNVASGNQGRGQAEATIARPRTITPAKPAPQAQQASTPPPTPPPTPASDGPQDDLGTTPPDWGILVLDVTTIPYKKTDKKNGTVTEGRAYCVKTDAAWPALSGSRQGEATTFDEATGQALFAIKGTGEPVWIDVQTNQRGQKEYRNIVSWRR